MTDIDITDDSQPPVELSAKDDCELQIGMMLVHRYYLGIELCRAPTDAEMAQSWVDKGFAAMYRKHVRRG